MTGLPAAPRGRTTISSRALDRVATVVAAEALGVDSGQVSVDLTDHVGDLAIAVRSPIRIPPLRRIQADPSALERSGGTLLERAALAQEHIGRRVGELTGSIIGQVTVRLTGAVVLTERRVR
ncbi:hypothetical protein HQQ81_04770 [Microbacteriaceae bacterium VKM Ac-2854]|nr:hypothetical protein [Microbacteriaceae bacterium VKM Ac-2854]